MPAKIAVGMRYGDEGKGHLVDYLANVAEKQNRPILVVRTNGGAQAAHNVMVRGRQYDRSQTFGSVGSGAFAGAATLIAPPALYDPSAHYVEARSLQRQYGNGNIYVHENCLLVTPYHYVASRLWSEKNRGMTCGMGIWETEHFAFQRPEEALHADDLYSMGATAFCDKLMCIRDYFNITEDDLRKFNYSIVPNSIRSNLISYAHFASIADDSWWLEQCSDSNREIIFEGAQGVMLDRKHGHLPHTTSSDTTMKAPLRMLRDYEGDVEKIGILRIYDTRHGAGKFESEDADVSFPEMHNATGKYQGAWRRGWLNLDELVYANSVIAPGGVDTMAITHLDRWTENKKGWHFYGNLDRNRHYPPTERGLTEYIMTLVNHVKALPKYFSHSPYRDGWIEADWINMGVKRG